MLLRRIWQWRTILLRTTRAPVNDDNEIEDSFRKKKTKTKNKVTDNRVVKVIKKVPKVPSRKKKLSSLPKQGKLATVLKTASSSKKVKKANSSDASVLHAYDNSLLGTTVTCFAGTPVTPIIENQL